jgi:hypothetical protein
MLVRLALATVRARWVSFTGSLLALAAGVALVTTAGAAIVRRGRPPFSGRRAAAHR